MTQESKKIFTIGHSNHSIEEFVSLLKNYKIDIVADVRSTPHSKYCPQFNKETLENALKAKNVKYLFLGNELGARPKDNAFYNSEGAVDFVKLANSDNFKEGIKRLMEIIESYTTVLMCSEKDPLGCHRTILIAKVLKNQSVHVFHILSNGDMEVHEQLEKRMMKFNNIEKTLFDQNIDEENLIQQAYEEQLK